jgi:hypothetical protein
MSPSAFEAAINSRADIAPSRTWLLRYSIVPVEKAFSSAWRPSGLAELL